MIDDQAGPDGSVALRGRGPAGRQPPSASAALPRRVHDQADSGQAHRGADVVEAVGPEAVDHDAPGQRPGDEHAPVGREDPAEVGVVVDGFRPDRFDYLGAAVCLAGVGLIMYAPR